jgi:predicted O-methyltransferase YrrM
VPEQGNLIYLLCRGLRANRVAEFATSIGMSTLYFAAAVRDNGGGMVIGSELVPAKVEAARHNLAEAGLADYAEIRQGDARQTLRDLGGPCRLRSNRRLAAQRRTITRAPGNRNKSRRKSGLGAMS